MPDSTSSSVQRCVDVLNALEGAPEGMTMSELLVETRIAKASLYRVAATLEQNGYLVRQGLRGASYHLGPRILDLSRNALAGNNMPTVAQPYLDTLASEFGQTAKLTVRDGLEAVTVAVAQAEWDYRLTARVGVRFELYLGPSVRLLLAYAPEEVVEAVLTGPRPKQAANTITDPATFRDSLARARELGWATGVNEGVEGIGSIAAIVSAAGRPGCGVMSIVFRAGDFEPDDHLRDTLCSYADDISRKLGSKVLTE